jgi:branched-chain amino acid aminotransferase
MVDITNLIIFKNGEFIPGIEATISIFDRGLLYGDAIFEGIREYSGKVFKLDEHLDRLYESAKIIAISIPIRKLDMKNIILELLRKNNFQDAYIRPIVTRGSGSVGVDPRGDLAPTIIVYAHPWAPFLGANGIKMKTVSTRRVPPQSMDSRVKHVGYLNSIMAKLESNIANADDALILDVNGFVTEASAANFLIIKSGAIISPTKVNILDGITRRVVLNLANQIGLVTQETNITLGDVYTADEAFVCGTGAEIVPVKEVDGRAIGMGVPGSITLQLISLFHELVKKEGTPVY